MKKLILIITMSISISCSHQSDKLTLHEPVSSGSNLKNLDAVACSTIIKEYLVTVRENSKGLSNDDLLVSRLKFASGFLIFFERSRDKFLFLSEINTGTVFNEEVKHTFYREICVDNGVYFELIHN